MHHFALIAGLFTNFGGDDVFGAIFLAFTIVCLLVVLWNAYRIFRGR